MFQVEFVLGTPISFGQSASARRSREAIMTLLAEREGHSRDKDACKMLSTMSSLCVPDFSSIIGLGRLPINREGQYVLLRLTHSARCTYVCAHTCHRLRNDRHRDRQTLNGRRRAITGLGDKGQEDSRLR